MSLRPFRTRRTAAFALLPLLTLQACYTSVPSTVAAVPVGTKEVHVSLTPEGATTLVSTLGPRAAALDGQIVERTDSTLGMVVTHVSRTTGSTEDWPSEKMQIPLRAVGEVRTQQLSRSKSVLLAGGIAVAAFFVGRGLSGSQGSGTTRSTGGQEPGK